MRRRAGRVSVECVTHAFFTTWVGINFTARYDPAMSSASAEIGQRIRSHVDKITADLRHASVALESGALTMAEMTDVMKTAFTDRNRLDAALIGAVGALDKVSTERAPGGELTGGLPSVKNGYPARTDAPSNMRAAEPSKRRRLGPTTLA
jgi:hypothetical protein